MADSRPLSEEERTELIAYLDGELDGPAAHAIEAKLNLDPRTRHEVETLRNTWAMLDYLPRPEASPTFTSRTLERVSTLRPAPSVTAAKSRRSLVFQIAWAAAVLLAGLLGYGSVHWALRHERVRVSPVEEIDVDQQLVRDLRVIENKRLYDQVDDFDFLRKLDDPDLFGDGG